ncbi:MAG: malate synthase [Alphaproteobacteria bacterium]|jgi:malate synthase
MNMPIADINRRYIQTQSLAAEPVLSVVKMSPKINSSVLESYRNPYEMLDQYFTLQDGSHKDVKQYVIYFCHVMAFFADGSHCGLAQPKQFVAFLGYKDSPESIVLKENNTHIEVILNAHNNTNQRGTDIQIEFPSQCDFNSAAGEDYFVE